MDLLKIEEIEDIVSLVSKKQYPATYYRKKYYHKIGSLRIKDYLSFEKINTMKDFRLTARGKKKKKESEIDIRDKLRHFYYISYEEIDKFYERNIDKKLFSPCFRTLYSTIKTLASMDNLYCNEFRPYEQLDIYKQGLFFMKIITDSDIRSINQKFIEHLYFETFIPETEIYDNRIKEIFRNAILLENNPYLLKNLNNYLDNDCEIDEKQKKIIYLFKVENTLILIFIFVIYILWKFDHIGIYFF